MRAIIRLCRTVRDEHGSGLSASVGEVNPRDCITNWFGFSTEVQAKKVFTVEEKAMRRAEMARRRRNLSEKRNEEVKVCELSLPDHLTAELHLGWLIVARFTPITARDNQQAPQKASQQDQSQEPSGNRRGGQGGRGRG